MQQFELQAEKVGKIFQRRPVFADVSLRLTGGDILGITGKNGSGKSTFVKILCGILSPDKGSITLTIDGKMLKSEERPSAVGFVSPYLMLYEEFSPMEHLELTAKLRGKNWDKTRAEDILQRVGLIERRHEEIRTYSSGMKQRVKYAVALQHEPPILIFDEPMTNLDAIGQEFVESIVRAHSANGGGVILATNDARDKALCSALLSVEAAIN